MVRLARTPVSVRLAVGALCALAVPDGAALFGFPLSLGGGAAWAQPVARGKNSPVQARKLFTEAQELRQAGKPGPALAKLREAYEALPTPTLLWPIAELCAQLQQPVEGLDALGKYRAQMTPDQMEPGQQAADADKLEARLRAQLGYLIVNGGAGASVAIDGRDVGRGPFPDKIAVNPGSHKVTATSPRGNAEATFEVVQSGEAKVTLPDGPIDKGSMVVSNGSRATVSQPGGDGASSSPMNEGRYFPHNLTWVAIGVTGATLLSATFVGAAALAKTNGIADQCVPEYKLCFGSAQTDINQLNSDVSSQRTLSTTALVLWGVGGAFAIGTAVLIGIDAHRQKSGRTLLAGTRPGPGGIRLETPRAGLSPEGTGGLRFDFALGGRF